ncbi:ser/Thr protein phosphatase family protein [Xylariaceae sp. FL1019]|nr:ser/Thr protein phosphatase family protein [Xylariaceae sp. FL1019]
MSVKTRFLIISDTHGCVFDVKGAQKADVVIHCGDLTDGSDLSEHRRTLKLLREIDSPLKLVIAGNHDFTLDTPAFRKLIEEAPTPLEPELVDRTYGRQNEARQLYDETPGITFLDEGTHKFTLANNTTLTVYASPFTPSKTCAGAYQYAPSTGHDFSIDDNVDAVITHGPPHGIMDMTDSKERAGCPQLFTAICKARPIMHCFGHIHEGWGAKMIAWRDQIPEQPSHFNAIDNSRAIVVDKLTNLTSTKFDDVEARAQKRKAAEFFLRQGFRGASHCRGDEHRLEKGIHTLFVNASVEGGKEELPMQPPWLVDIELPVNAQHDEGK